jgi:hypothetical protein
MEFATNKIVCAGQSLELHIELQYCNCDDTYSKKNRNHCPIATIR